MADQWEYKILDYHQRLVNGEWIDVGQDDGDADTRVGQRELNIEGDAGWEIVGILPYVTSAGSTFYPQTGGVIPPTRTHIRFLAKRRKES